MNIRRVILIPAVFALSLASICVFAAEEKLPVTYGVYCPSNTSQTSCEQFPECKWCPNTPSDEAPCVNAGVSCD